MRILLILLLYIQCSFASDVHQMYNEAEIAMSQNNIQRAIDLYEEILSEPLNEFTKDSLEKLGDAYLINKDPNKAITQYKQYLELFKNSPHYIRIKEQLEELAPKEVPIEKEKKPDRKKWKEGKETIVSGSLSQYYYIGVSDSETLGRVMHTRDTSSLITSFDITYKEHNDQHDYKIIFKDTQLHNILGSDKNQVTSAYIDYKNSEYDYGLKIGRQPGINNGTYNRFDGIYAKKYINDYIQFNGSIGQIDNGSHSKIDLNRYFRTLGISLGPYYNTSISGYLNQQFADSIQERNAYGGDIRYYNNGINLYSVVEYDSLYKSFTLNTNQLTYEYNDWVLDVLYDTRRSYMLTGDTILALLPGATKLSEVDKALGNSIYSSTLDLTGNVTTIMLGVGYKITPNWTLSGSVREYKQSASKGTKYIPANKGFEPIYTYSIQLQGQQVIFDNDTLVLYTMYIVDNAYTNKLFSIAHSVNFNKWRSDSSFRYSLMTRDNGDSTSSISPSLRISYRLSDTTNLEVQANLDIGSSNLTNIITDRLSKSIFIGYRTSF